MPNINRLHVGVAFFVAAIPYLIKLINDECKKENSNAAVISILSICLLGTLVFGAYFVKTESRNQRIKREFGDADTHFKNYNANQIKWHEKQFEKNVNVILAPSSTLEEQPLTRKNFDILMTAMLVASKQHVETPSLNFAAETSSRLPQDVFSYIAYRNEQNSMAQMLPEQKIHAARLSAEKQLISEKQNFKSQLQKMNQPILTSFFNSATGEQINKFKIGLGNYNCTFISNNAYINTFLKDYFPSNKGIEVLKELDHSRAVGAITGALTNVYGLPHDVARTIGFFVAKTHPKTGRRAERICIAAYNGSVKEESETVGNAKSDMSKLPLHVSYSQRVGFKKK